MRIQKNTRKLVLSAVLLALATVLSLIKIFHMPLGGSVTLLSMLPIVVISISYGVRWGLFMAFLFSLLRLYISVGSVSGYAVTPAVLIGTIFFDYILAYTVLGLSGIFSKTKKTVLGIGLGVTLAVFLRFLSHCISGTIFFASTVPPEWNPIIWSVCYNSYLLPEAIGTVICSTLLFKLPIFEDVWKKI